MKLPGIDPLFTYSTISEGEIERLVRKAYDACADIAAKMGADDVEGWIRKASAGVSVTKNDTGYTVSFPTVTITKVAKEGVK